MKLYIVTVFNEVEKYADEKAAGYSIIAVNEYHD